LISKSKEKYQRGINMTKAKIKIASLVIILMMIFTTKGYSQAEFRWMSVGSLHNWYSNYGSEIEQGFGQQQQFGLRWPALYPRQDVQAMKGFWIGYDDNGQAKVVHVGPRVSGQNEFFPVKFKSYRKYDVPELKAKGQSSLLESVEDPDEVDPNIPFDQMIVNEVHTKIGISMKRIIGQFMSDGHDNYIINDYTFKYTGIIDDKGTQMSSMPTLNGVYFFYIFRLSCTNQARHGIGNATGWGMAQTSDAIGDSNPDYPQAGLTIPSYLRAQYGWQGKYPSFTTYDNVGGMVIDGNFTYGDKNDTTGRLAAPQFAGVVHLFASNGPNKFDITTDDDPTQPSTTITIDSDHQTMSANSIDNKAKCNLEYDLMKKGHDKRHLDKIGEPLTYFEDAKPTKDPAAGSNGGFQFCNGYGPYTLNPGDSIRIVWAEAVDGLSRKEAIEVGMKYKSYGPAGMLTDNAIKEKNREFFKGRIRLINTFDRAWKNFYNNYQDAKDAFVAPLKKFEALPGNGKNIISWDFYDGQKPDTILIYRTEQYYYNELNYKEVAKISGSDLDKKKYDDTSATTGQSSFYYAICKKGNNKSIRINNQLLLEVTKKPRIDYTKEDSVAINNLEKARVVPNPYVITGNADTHLWGSAKPNTIYFRGIPARTKIDIYTEMGEHIYSMETSPDDIIEKKWDCQTKYNQTVVTGVYIAVLKNLDNGKTKVLKFVVIR